MQLSKDLREFCELLNSNGVDYLVVGAMAVAFHGYPRLTADLDLFVRPDLQNASQVIAALKHFGFDPQLTADELARSGKVLVMGVKPNRIDLLTSISGVSFDEAWSTRVPGDLDGIPAQFIGQAALIRNKESAGRPKDLGDADELKKRVVSK
jgi:hypothetical protein